MGAVCSAPFSGLQMPWVLALSSRGSFVRIGREGVQATWSRGTVSHTCLWLRTIEGEKSKWNATVGWALSRVLGCAKHLVAFRIFSIHRISLSSPRWLWGWSTLGRELPEAVSVPTPASAPWIPLPRPDLGGA